MEEDGNSPLPIRITSAALKSRHHEKSGRRCGRKMLEKRTQRDALIRGNPRTASAVSGLGHLHAVMMGESANMIAPNLALGDAVNRQEQHTEDQAFKTAHQGNLFFDLPLPLSLVDEDSSGDESEDDAFYRAIGLFGDIQGFGIDNTLRVCLT
ncbi:hypothetical protein DRE_06241 [Drechslerella stenobrocha 248]|uniref:Uncharacterized protein n=1 Tax=Drechslerella stenobrocha 248 TaxID=1043628 RepID=W7HY91_9PEZI|nr:hypothetical protein DRE_06241 [Drechslerella stenobrocha 248]